KPDSESGNTKENARSLRAKKFVKGKSDQELKAEFLEALEEGFRKEAQKKILEGGRFFTVRSKKSKLLCFASLISEEGENRNYQVVRYKDKKTKWVSYEELLEDFDLIDADPKPCPIDWISPNYKEKALDDESFREHYMKKINETRNVKTNAQNRSKSMKERQIYIHTTPRGYNKAKFLDALGRSSSIEETNELGE
ncbi:hypothetical protein LEP1GSC161_0067, partial [Leptospira santarosai str. CBC1416]